LSANKTFVWGAAVLGTGWLLCLGEWRGPDKRHGFEMMHPNSFRDEGIAKTDRLVQDPPTRPVLQAMGANHRQTWRVPH
jgi:hypothetical protein